MTVSLLAGALVKFLLGAGLTGALLFLSAGTWEYPRGWLFMAILFIPMFLAGLVLMVRNPELLRKRLNAREKEGTQRRVIALGGLMFLAGFLLAGLSFRYSWLLLPRWVSAAGTVLFLISYGLYGEVVRENTYLSRTIEIQENQQVVSTGLYGIVRHPMYAVTVALFLSIPLVLGSLLSLFVFLLHPVLMVLRIRNEEKVLENGLPGYREYEKKVPWRLFPGIW